MSDAAKKEPALQLGLFGDPPVTEEAPPKKPKKLRLEEQRSAVLVQGTPQIIEGIAQPVLPTRWERLKPKLGDDTVSLRTIIRPIPKAMSVVRSIIQYIKTTDGCQVLVIRADTGSGKTTFLNTLPHYMPDISFHMQTLDIQQLDEEAFSKALWSLKTPNDGVINLIILEGREKPQSITDKYIQVVLANINRFARTRGVPLLFVIPTTEDYVARSWCDHGTRIGDLIPEQKLYEGSRWYNFPGVPKDKYVEVVEETVRTLNPPRSLYDFGVSPDEVKSLAQTSTTIGRLIETLAGRISEIRSTTTLPLEGKRDHVWVVYVAPDLRHFDHTYLIIDGLCQDEKLRVSAPKLITPESDTSLAQHWKQPTQWAKLVATINLLDVRLINLPIITVVTAALTYGDESLLQSFKTTPLEKYRSEILEGLFPTLEEMPATDIDWSQPLAERRLQIKNARESLERTNLFLLLRGTPAEPQKGKSESVKVFAQYLHLRQIAHESDLHFFMGSALRDLLTYRQFPGIIGVETEQPFISGRTDPIPDVTIRADADNYALEFHFMRKQFTSSEIARYALKNVIEKNMRSLPYLSSLLDSIQHTNE